jgi:glycosyltransferase involved in cell wall biosynthesis
LSSGRTISRARCSRWDVSPAHLLAAIGDEFARARVLRWWRGGDVAAGVKELVPFTWLPWAVARLARPLWMAYSRMIGVSSDWNASCCLIVDEPRFVGLVAKTNCVVVYRATDLYAALRDDQTIVAAEKVLCERAQVLVATSEPVAEHLRALSGKPVSVITNGVDFEHFATVAEASGEFNLPGGRSQRAVYVGAFDRRFSRTAVRAAARALPDKYFLLGGPGSRAVAAELALPNVIALGVVPYRQVAGVLQQCAVGLLPFAPGAANEGRSPMKLYEYAASGLTVAASDTAELTRRRLPTLCVCSSEEEFPRAVAAAFDLSHDGVRVAAAREIAGSQGWLGKAKELLSLIGSHQLALEPRDGGVTSSVLRGG